MKKDFNAEKETKGIIKWIQDYFKDQPNANGAILGISGGKDSTVVSKLLVEALGQDRVFGILMPNGQQKDILDSLWVVNSLGIKYTTVNINGAYEGLINAIEKIELKNQSLINIAPRLRMTTLYAIGTTMGYRVCGTGNKSEGFVGYTTKFGDNACDFNPIADFDTEEVLAIGDYLGINYDLVHKTPSDGLCGKSDEDNLGFTYHQVNEYMDNGTCGDEEIDKIILGKNKANLHKSSLIPKYTR